MSAERSGDRSLRGMPVCCVGTSIARPPVGHAPMSAERSGDRSLRGDGGLHRRGGACPRPPVRPASMSAGDSAIAPTGDGGLRRRGRRPRRPVCRTQARVGQGGQRIAAPAGERIHPFRHPPAVRRRMTPPPEGEARVRFSACIHVRGRAMLVPTGTGMRAAEGVGPYGDGETDCHTSVATLVRNDTVASLRFPPPAFAILRISLVDKCSLLCYGIGVRTTRVIYIPSQRRTSHEKFSG